MKHIFERLVKCPIIPKINFGENPVTTKDAL